MLSMSVFYEGFQRLREVADRLVRAVKVAVVPPQIEFDRLLQVPNKPIMQGRMFRLAPMT